MTNFSYNVLSFFHNLARLAIEFTALCDCNKANFYKYGPNQYNCMIIAKPVVLSSSTTIWSNARASKHFAFRNISEVSPERIFRKFSKLLPERAGFGSFWSEALNFYTKVSKTNDRGWWPRCRKCLESKGGSVNIWLAFRYIFFLYPVPCVLSLRLPGMTQLS